MREGGRPNPGQGISSSNEGIPDVGTQLADFLRKQRVREIRALLAAGAIGGVIGGVIGAVAALAAADKVFADESPPPQPIPATGDIGSVPGGTIFVNDGSLPQIENLPPHLKNPFAPNPNLLNELPPIEPTTLFTGDKTEESTPTPTATPTPTETPDPTPTSTLLSEETSTPTATQKSTKVSPSPNPTQEIKDIPLGPVTFKWDIGEGVPEADVELIKEGIRLAQDELEKYYGGDIKRPIDNPITVKIVTTGLGNQEPGGMGGSATALDEVGARLFFDVLQKDHLSGDAVSHKITAAHEYIHAWQNSLGCLTIHDQPLGNWMNEGIASYIPIKMFVRSGVLNDQVARYLQYFSAKATGELSQPLDSLEGGGPWAGHVGFLAVESLVSQAPSGLLSLRTICELTGLDRSRVDMAFQTAFGQSRSNFYQNFPAYLQNLRTSPIYLEQARRLPPGTPTWIPEGSQAYELNFVAYGFEDLTQEEQRGAWVLTPEMCGWGSNEIGKMTVALCNAESGTYPISVTMPDGRTAEMPLIHSEEN